MRSALYWLEFGLCAVVGLTLLVFGVFFMRQVYFSLHLAQGEAVFSSLLLGVVLFLVGGGIVCSTVARSIKRAFARGRVHT